MLTQKITPNQKKCFSTIVVDDSALQLLVTSSFVKKHEDLEFHKGFTNPVKALEYLFQKRVDLVVLDLDMPSLHGLTIIPALRKMNQRVMVFSNNKALENQALALGAETFETKGHGLEGFNSGVAECLFNANHYQSAICA